MKRRLLQSAALIAVAVLTGACVQTKMGVGCGSPDPPNEGPRGAPSSDPNDGEPDHEPGDRDYGKRVSVTGGQQDQQERSDDPRTDPARSTVVDKGADITPPDARSKPERPWAHNTGPSDSGALKPSGSLTITTDGSLLENLDVSGMVTIDADKVTIRNFRIDAMSSYGIRVVDGHSGIVLEDGEIYGMRSAAILGVGFAARRLHIHDSEGDGFKVQGTGGPTVVEYCFIEKMGRSPEAHADGNQTRGGSNITFRYNNIWMPNPGTPNYPGTPYKANANFMLQLTINNFVIDSNWLNGGSYTIYCGNTGGTGVFVRNNLFGRENGGWTSGKQNRHYRSGTCAEWTNNRWEDSGDPI